MPSAAEDYRKLHQASRHAQLINSVSQLLEWDQETYMPSGGQSLRSEQLMLLAGMAHQERTGAKFAALLDQLIDISSGQIKVHGLSAPQESALKCWRRDYLQESLLPTDFVEEFAGVTSQAQAVWRMVLGNHNYLQLAPFLDKIVQLCRKKADYLGFDEHPYDALLDLYEPEMTTGQVDAIFSRLEPALKALLKKIGQAPQVEDHLLSGSFDPQKQLDFSRLLLEAMGFDHQKGRLDLSAHPFSVSLHPDDNRITTRIHPTSLLSNIDSVLHEAGHALYEMGLPPEQFGSPLGQPISYAMHESQSRFWETRIGKSRGFWQHYLPLLKSTFKGQLDALSLEEFYRAINKVQPGLIRVEADEVSYPLHVILRFQLERQLIEGSLSVADLPEAWNAKMQQMMGLCPGHVAEGCLQDVHWSLGLFGYFPSYALGNAYASHLFLAFEQSFPDWQARLASGDLLFVRTWLCENVHRYGRQYTSGELLEKVTKLPFGPEAYLDYLNDKYLAIYS